MQGLRIAGNTGQEILASLTAVSIRMPAFARTRLLCQHIRPLHRVPPEGSTQQAADADCVLFQPSQGCIAARLSCWQQARGSSRNTSPQAGWLGHWLGSVCNTLGMYERLLLIGTTTTA